MRHQCKKPDTLIGNKHFASAPTSSWWVGLDREALSREREVQSARMRNSRYGAAPIGDSVYGQRLMAGTVQLGWRDELAYLG